MLLNSPLLPLWIFIFSELGDYVLQSDWMASEKTNQTWPALAHAAAYTVLFCFISFDLRMLGFIAGTHFVIDRWRLARHVCWAKNFLAPPGKNFLWSECNRTGYHKSKPDWLTVWLMIRADNALHLLCNALAVTLYAL